MPTQVVISGIVVDFWTVISVSGAKATVWFRMGDESNHEAFKALIPELGLLTEEDAQEETGALLNPETAQAIETSSTATPRDLSETALTVEVFRA